MPAAGCQGVPGGRQGIGQAGHRVDSHLYTHDVILLDPVERVEEELVLTEEEFARQGIPWTGMGATGMYPNGIDERPDIQSLLVRRGYRWCSSKYNTKMTLEELQPYWLNDSLLEIPCPGMSDRHYFYNTTAPTHGFIDMSKAMLSKASDKGMVCVLCLHPGVLSKFDPECSFVLALLEHAGRLGVPVITLNEIRERFQSQ